MISIFTRSFISSSKFLHFRVTQLGPEAISRSIGPKSGVAPTHDFGRYTCMQYWSPPVMPSLQTVHKVIDNNPSMVRSREHRELHHSVDANSYTTVFNFANMGWVRVKECVFGHKVVKKLSCFVWMLPENMIVHLL